MDHENRGISATTVILLVTFVFLVFIIVSGYQTTQEIKNRERPNEITEAHTKEAYKSGLYFLRQKLNKDDEIFADTLEITSRTAEPEYQHIYIVSISGHYVLDDFEDAYGRSRVRDDWKVKVEYVGPEDGEWNIKEKRNNWELMYVNYDLE